MKWFRFYSEFRHDPKLKRMPKEHRFAFVILLCLANDSATRGSITGLDDEDLAFELEMELEDWQTLKAKFRTKGLIDLIEGGIQITNWDKRQFASDSSAERVAKHRSKKKKRDCNVTETLAKRHVTSPDTDTDPDTDNRSRSRSEIRDLDNLPVDPIHVCADQENANFDKFADTHEKSAFVCAEVIESGQEKTASETPLTNVEVVSDQKTQDPQDHEKGKSSGARRGKKVKIPNAEFEVFREVYNDNKPSAWGECQVLNEERLKMLRKYHAQLGEQMMPMFCKALRYASSDNFWSGIDGSFQTIFRDNRIVTWAETPGLRVVSTTPQQARQVESWLNSDYVQQRLRQEGAIA